MWIELTITRMKGFSRLTTIKDALNTFYETVHLERMPAETLRIISCLGRVLADDLTCPRDVPPFDRSAMDGYAVRAEDLYAASDTNPVVLALTETPSSIGSPPKETLNRGEAMKIATGAPIPVGASAVIMVEYTEETGPGKVEIHRPVTPGENVSARGEDVKAGQPILTAGSFLQPQDIGIMAALGLSEVSIVCRPRVAVLSNGNELVDVGIETVPGKIVDSNRPTILSLVKASGGEPVDLGITSDDRDLIAQKISRSLDSVDMVLVSGGTSVGEKDLLPGIVNSLGKPGVIVHGVAMRPGRPVALCALGLKPILLLPGFPVAAMMAYDVFAEPIMLKLMGARSRAHVRPTLRAAALRRVPSITGTRSFVRVLVMKKDGRTVFEPLRATGSGIISSMVRANGMLVIPENKEGVEEGEEAMITLLRPLEEDMMQ